MSHDFALRVRDLGKSFARERRGARARFLDLVGRRQASPFWAIRHVTFDVRRGEGLGIIGRNGAGKSTLLKVLSRVLEPTEGEAALYGRLNSLLEIGTGFQAELSGRDNIYLNASILGMSRAEVHEVFDRIVEFSGLRDFLDMPVKHYSSGMYSRLAFSVAAHVPGDILALDEVLSVGDAEFRSKCQARMAQMMGTDRTVLFVSHSMDAILRFCTSAVWIERGEVRAHGLAADVVKAYLRSVSRLSSAVVLPGGVASMDQAPPERRLGEELAASGVRRPRNGNGGEAEQSVSGEMLCAARFRSVALTRIDGVPDDVFPRHEPICVRMDYDVLSETPPVQCVLHVHCLPRKGIPDEVHLFTATTPAGTGPAEAGRYVTTARIPANLLTTGQYSVSVALVTSARPLIRHDKLERIVSFRVMDEEGADGQFMLDALHGVIYPCIEWHASVCDATMQEVDS